MPVSTASSTKLNCSVFVRADTAIKIAFCRAKEIQFFNAKARRRDANSTNSHELKCAEDAREISQALVRWCAVRKHLRREIVP
jgi:hypothetical protein